MLPTLSKRHFGIWKSSRWVGGWIGNVPEPQDKCELDSAVFVSAPYAMMLRTEKGISLTQYLPGLKPDTKYRLSFYVKLQDVRPIKARGGVCANIWDDANRWFPAHNYLTGTLDWTFQSYELTTGKDTNKKVKSYLNLRILNAAGTAWFDDVRLEEL